MKTTVFVVYIIKAVHDERQHMANVFFDRDVAERFLKKWVVNPGDMGRIEDVLVNFDGELP